MSSPVQPVADIVYGAAMIAEHCELIPLSVAMLDVLRHHPAISGPWKMLGRAMRHYEVA